MKTLVAALALLLSASTAWAQDVDVQCRIISSASSTEINSQAFGAVGQPVYWHCNQPMPYVVPADRWLCINSATASMYFGAAQNAAGAGAYMTFNHDRPGHEYHGFTFPPQVETLTPMAVPPGEPTILIMRNGLSRTVYTKVRLAGYLGAPATVTNREEACR